MNENDLVVIVNDGRAVRVSLQRLLRLAGINVWLFQSAEASMAGKNLENLQADCMLLDLAGVGGIELLERLHKEGSVLPVIVMTSFSDVKTAIRAIKAGALECLEKPFAQTALLAAMKITEGGCPVNQMPAPPHPRIEEARAQLAMLSRREGQVLDALARGDCQKLIAFDLGISVRTVEVHRARMLRRLGARNIAQAISLSAIANLKGREFDPSEAA